MSALDEIDALPWHDPAALFRAASPFLDDYANPQQLARQLEACLANEALRAEIEIKAHQYKIVLFRSRATRRNLTLHVYGPEHRTRRAWIHNHRWSFVSRVLRGALEHELFQPTFDGDRLVSAGPLMQLVREPAGTTYLFGTGIFHRVYADPWTATLLLRDAPSLQDASYFLETGEVFSHRGSTSTPWRQKEQDVVERAVELEALRDRLWSAGVLA